MQIDTATDTLIGTAEAAEMLGVTREAMRLRAQAGTRPTPIGKLRGRSGSRLYSRNEVLEAVQLPASRHHIGDQERRT